MMNKSELVKGLKGVADSLSMALDEQQRASNGQFGSGGSSTTAGSAKNKAAGQAAANAFAGGSSTAAKNAARLLANKTSMGTTSTPGRVQTGAARLKSTLASNASRNGKN